MKSEQRKHFNSQSKVNNIKAKDKKYLKNWWEDCAEYSKKHSRQKAKEDIKRELNNL